MALTINAGPSNIAGFEGQNITIFGTDFSATIASNVLKINGTACTITAATTTQLTSTVPFGTTTGQMNVTVNGVTSNNVLFTIIPTITNIATRGAAAGTTNTVYGSGFSAIASENYIWFKTPSTNEIMVYATSSTPTSATFVTPSGILPNSTVTVGISSPVVTANGNGSVSYDAVPTITSGPSSIAGFEAQNIAVFGTNFSTTIANNVLKINGTTCSISAATATQLTATVPTGATTGQMSVTVNGIASNSILFTIIPTITGIQYSSCAVGATNTVYGKGFSAIASQNYIWFKTPSTNEVMVYATSSTPTSATFVTPSGIVANSTVTVGISSPAVTANGNGSVTPFNLASNITVTKSLSLMLGATSSSVMYSKNGGTWTTMPATLSISTSDSMSYKGTFAKKAGDAAVYASISSASYFAENQTASSVTITLPIPAKSANYTVSFYGESVKSGGTRV